MRRPASTRAVQRPARMLALGLLMLGGCASPRQDAATLARDAQQATLGVPAELPVMMRPMEGELDARALPWQTFVRDADLRALVDKALSTNRDLRLALLAVEQAQAQARASGAARLPNVGLGAGVQRAPDSSGDARNSFSVGLQLLSWEVDFFGRLNALDEAARAQVLASDAGRRAAEFSLIAQILQTALNLRADLALKDLAERSAIAREESLRLVALRERAGAASLIEVDTQTVLAAQARAAVALYARLALQELNALQALVGQELESTWVDAIVQPGAAERFTPDAWFSGVPVGLPSAVLLERPDVAAAEARLQAAAANVDAARRALWPSITLTAQAGQVGPQLADLFRTGNFAYSLAANAFLSIFDGGRRQAGIDNTEVVQRQALAQYEKTVQTAFRETADALTGAATWTEQRLALETQLKAARELAQLTRLKSDAGAASMLEQLEAERGLLSAELAAVQARQAELSARVALWKALGR